MEQQLLSILIWIPIIGGTACLMMGDDGDAESPRASLMRYAALLTTFVTFLLSVVLYIGFDNEETGRMDPGTAGLLLSRRRRHFDAADYPYRVHHTASGHCRLGCHQGSTGAVLCRLPVP